jgi:hypothetical protein
MTRTPSSPPSAQFLIAASVTLAAWAAGVLAYEVIRRLVLGEE